MISLYHFKIFRNFFEKLEGRSLCHRPTAWKKALSFFQKGKLLKDFSLLLTYSRSFSKNFRKNHSVRKWSSDYFVSFWSLCMIEKLIQSDQKLDQKLMSSATFFKSITTFVQRCRILDWCLKNFLIFHKCGNLWPVIDQWIFRKKFYSASTSFLTPLTDPCRVSWHFL